MNIEFGKGNVPQTICNSLKEIDLNLILKKQWSSIENLNGIFRYKINNTTKRCLSGKYDYILQFNPERATNRRKAIVATNVDQPFDKSGFNFTQVSQDEVMFNITIEDNGSCTVLVNVSPISRYHCLLCPSLDECLPQVVTVDSLRLVSTLMFLWSESGTHIGFNSLCALASVNHLHYHILLEDHQLPVDTVECKHIVNNVYKLDDRYPVSGFCFQILNTSEINVICDDVYRLLKYFISRNIAHNIMFTRGSRIDACLSSDIEVVRIIIWPRKNCNGVKQYNAFNIAVLEMSGYFPVFTTEDYNSLTCEDLECELNKWQYDDFNNLIEVVQTLYV